MLNKFKILLLLLGTGALCPGIAACAALSPVEDLQSQGYTIKVSYDPNGGAFLGNSGVTVVDLFNPSRLEKDGEGNVSIKLLEPTDPRRPSGSDSEDIVLTRSGHFLVGWYETRHLVTD